MRDEKRKAEKSAAYIRERIDGSPAVGVLTGTGLGGIGNSVENPVICSYAEIPHFPLSTVESHPGRLLSGRMAGRSVVVLQGRLHLYEGYSPLEVTFPIRVMQQLGVKVLIVTNAAGGIDTGYSPGDIMIIQDHINLTGVNPLTGPNETTWGLRFPDMGVAYDRSLQEAVRAGAGAASIPVRTGVYVGLQGPSLETPAEIRFLKIIGADAVGFSTIQEVIAGVHAGMRVVGLSTITNINDPDNPAPATVEEIIAVANRAAPGVEKLIHSAVEAADVD